MDYLLLDANFLFQRSRYSIAKSGVHVFVGVLRDLDYILNLFGFPEKSIVWTFDSSISLRSRIYNQYKNNRIRSSEDDGFYAEMAKCRKNVLSRFFSNVLYEEGYEADDLIAKLVNNNNGEIIVVSNDSDLYQLLSNDCSIWSPAKKYIFTYAGFVQKYGIFPSQWIRVKSIAGCNTDNIKGVKGIGEKTAIQYVAGKTTRQSVIEKISKAYDVIERNERLVSLPFEGCSDISLKKCSFGCSSFRELKQEFGVS